MLGARNSIFVHPEYEKSADLDRRSSERRDLLILIARPLNSSVRVGGGRSPERGSFVSAKNVLGITKADSKAFARFHNTHQRDEQLRPPRRPRLLTLQAPFGDILAPSWASGVPRPAPTSVAHCLSVCILNTYTHTHTHTFIYMCLCVCVSV